MSKLAQLEYDDFNLINLRANTEEIMREMKGPGTWKWQTLDMTLIRAAQWQFVTWELKAEFDDESKAMEQAAPVSLDLMQYYNDLVFMSNFYSRRRKLWVDLMCMD